MSTEVTPKKLGAFSAVIGAILGILIGLALLLISGSGIMGLIIPIAVDAFFIVMWFSTKKNALGWLWIMASAIGVICPVCIPLAFLGVIRIAEFYKDSGHASTRTTYNVGSTNGANSTQESPTHGVTPRSGSRFGSGGASPTGVGRGSRFGGGAAAEDSGSATGVGRGSRFGGGAKAEPVVEEKKEPTLFEALLDPDYSDPVVLFDGEGGSRLFDKVCTVPIDDRMFAVVSPREPMEGVPEGTAIVYEMGYIDGNERLMPVPDDNIVRQVFAEYQRMYEEYQASLGDKGNGGFDNE